MRRRLRGALPLLLTALVASPLAAQRTRAASRPTASPAAAADAAYAAGDSARAVAEYERVLAANPSSGRALYRLAMLRRDRPAVAEALLRRYVAVEPGDAWGHIAHGDALARLGRVDDALAAYAAATRLAPGERDVAVGRARVLAGAGRLDAASEAYEGWLARRPLDADAWTELARVRRRSGQSREALRAAERSHALSTSARSAALVQSLRRAVAPAVEARALGSRDSDANARAGVQLTVALPEIGRERVSLFGGSRVVGREGLETRVDELGLTGAWRPLATTRLEAQGAVARRNGSERLNPVAPEPTGSAVTGRVRANWRAPSDAVRLDLRAQRLLLDASPELASIGAVRDEVGGQLDLRLVGPLRVRGQGRGGIVRTGSITNRRSLAAGALVLAGARGEVSGRVQRSGYAEPTLAGYFAYDAADAAEVGAYTELESATGATLALDVGAGVERVQRFGEPMSGWLPAGRLWAQAALPVGRHQLGFEVDTYDSSVPSEAALDLPREGARWRYAAASLWLRWTLR